MLRKYEPDPSHVISWTNLSIDSDASYEEVPAQIIDTREQVLRGRTIPLVKVQWQDHGIEECTWEREAKMRARFPALFSTDGMLF